MSCSVSESQVTAPGMGLSIYSDMTTNAQWQERSLVIITAWEPEMTSRENKHLKFINPLTSCYDCYNNMSLEYTNGVYVWC